MKGREPVDYIKTIEGKFEFEKKEFLLQKQLKIDKEGKPSGYYYLKMRSTNKPLFRFNWNAKVEINKTHYVINTFDTVNSIVIQSRKKYNNYDWTHVPVEERKRFLEFRKILLEHHEKGAILTIPRHYFGYLAILTKYNLGFMGHNLKVKYENQRIGYTLRKI